MTDPKTPGELRAAAWIEQAYRMLMEAAKAKRWAMRDDSPFEDSVAAIIEELRAEPLHFAQTTEPMTPGDLRSFAARVDATAACLIDDGMAEGARKTTYAKAAAIARDYASALERLAENTARERRLREALSAAERGLSIHYYRPRGQKTQADRDTCVQCDQNFRHEHHIRLTEGTPSDVRAEAIRQARAALSGDRADPRDPHRPPSDMSTGPREAVVAPLRLEVRGKSVWLEGEGFGIDLLTIEVCGHIVGRNLRKAIQAYYDHARALEAGGADNG